MSAASHHDEQQAPVAFTSAPIRLAAAIKRARQLARTSLLGAVAWREPAGRARRPGGHLCLVGLALVLLASLGPAEAANGATRAHAHAHTHSHGQLADPSAEEQQQARQQAHYLHIVPSTHFHYSEGRQARANADEERRDALEAAASQHSAQASVEGARAEEPLGQAHIYKRSSALLAPESRHSHYSHYAHYAPLVSSQRAGGPMNALTRRMMAAWSGPPSSVGAPEHEPGQVQQIAEMLAQQVGAHAAPEPELQRSSGSLAAFREQGASETASHQQADSQNDDQNNSNNNNNNNQQRRQAPRDDAQERLLMRQKQHIQYHDQWPSLAGKCHKRTLNFCASVLPFNTTTFPNIIGDTNRFEVKRSLPFFGFLAKSSCNKRLDELLCLLLEPPCAQRTGTAIPPCKKFCRLALEGCNEYIPATLAMSSVFDCRQYPESNDPNVCINLAQGSRCDADQFQCPDKTCIPKNWLCDGVRDCVFAADEANCTDSAGGINQPQMSVCSTEEFKCDGKCVPKAWRCDNERDCQDGTDEEGCDLRPRCGADRFRCADGNGCIPKRWVCDGKAECRDGSDETNCEQRECSENDFKCDNGICIPKLWRCDRQFDCKDGSDERACAYPAPALLLASTNQPATSGPQPTTVASLLEMNYANASQPQSQQPRLAHLELERLRADSASSPPPSSAAATSAAPPNTEAPAHVLVDERPAILDEGSPASSSSLAAQPEAAIAGESAAAKELNKFDYDIIHTTSSAAPQPAASEPSATMQPPTNPAQQQPQQPQPPTPSRAQPPVQLDFVGPVAGARRPSPQGRRANPLEPSQSALERLPIYRSLLKSLKGGPSRLPATGGPSGQAGMRGARPGAPGRRRRDRIGEEARPVAAGHQAPAEPAPELGPVPMAAHSASGLQAARSMGVASYLQMLNPRYNLRLSRGSSAPPAALAAAAAGAPSHGSA